jgi:large subunit ribosomal protein L30
MADKLRVTLRKSPISYTAKTRGTVRAMGLRRIGQTIELPDNPATRGMARSIRFLVEVEDSSTARAARSGGSKSTRSRDADAATPTSQPAEPERSAEADKAPDASEESA